MARQIRSDCRVGTLEKRLGVGPGIFRHPNGRDMRSDMKTGTLQLRKGCIWAEIASMVVLRMDPSFLLQFASAIDVCTYKRYHMLVEI